MGKIIVCGDSFSIGIGCEDLVNQPYGSLLSKEFNLELINLAKGSSTNLSIYLQVKYALEKYDNIDFVCVGTTCNNRIEWFKEDSKSEKTEITNEMINYHQYPPYVGKMDIFGNHPLSDNENYTGEILTENFGGVLDYIEIIENNRPHDLDYVEKYKKEPIEKLKILRDFYLYIRDHRIQKIYDDAIISMIHNILKTKNIKHLILLDHNDLDSLIPEKNLIKINWHRLCEKYPETKWYHTSYEGHIEVFNKIKDKIKNII